MGNQQTQSYNYGDFIGEERPGETRILRNPFTINKPLFSNNKLNLPSMYQAFEHSIRTFPNNNFLGTRKKLAENKYGAYEWKTYKEIEELVVKLCKGMTKNNFCPEIINEDKAFKFLGIYSKNREEWVITDLACQLNSITVVTIYDTLGLNALEFIFNQTQLTTLLLENNCLIKIMKLKAEQKTGAIKNLIAIDPFDKETETKCMELGLNLFSYEEILNQGIDYEMEFNKSTGDTILTFCYTSGTTGNPKGAMISNRSIMSGMHDMISIGFILNERDIYLSYLPLAHIMEQLLLGANIYASCSIGFYSGNATRISEDAIALKPTFFLGVPRVFQKFYELMTEKLNKLTGFKKKLAQRAIKEKLEDYDKYGKLTHPIYDLLVFNKTKAALGGNVKWMLVGSAPMQPEVIKFLRIAFCCPIVEGYGQTENCAGVLISHESDRNVGHLGGPTPGCEIKLVDCPEFGYYSTDINPITKQNEPRGEICVRGPLVFNGYYKDIEKTKEALDEEGWLHSGDIGVILRNQGNAIKIIDRVKNIFKLSQGEYVAPEKIENCLNQSKYVYQLFVYGESLHSYLVGILSPERSACVTFLKSIGIEATSENIEDYFTNKELKDEIIKDMEIIGRKNDLKGFELIKKIYLTNEPFSVENNLLTPTMKIKSSEARKRFGKQIQEMYSL